MRLAHRALETRCAVVDPPTRPPARESTDRLGQAVDGPRERSAATPWPRHAEAETPQRSEPSFGRGNCPVRTPGKKDKPLWTPTFGGPTETKKARSVVASSRVPRLAGFAGSPPAAGLPRTVNWPLVQIPADRHTTTGTCDLGKFSICANRPPAQGLFRSAANKFVRPESAQQKSRPQGKGLLSAKRR
jgi:hypothetical protein